MSENTVAITLDHPIEINGTTRTSLTLRRPLVRDLIAAERQPGDIAQEAALIAACADIPFEAAGRLDAADYSKIVSEAGLGFFSAPAGPPDRSRRPWTGGGVRRAVLNPDPADRMAAGRLPGHDGRRSLGLARSGR